MKKSLSKHSIRSIHSKLSLEFKVHTKRCSDAQKNKTYDEDFAKENADIIIYPLKEGKSTSAIYKLGKNNIKKIR
ncbi:MAG: hypothetical protein P8Y49_03060 [Sulfurovaceae bacterium]